MKAERSIAAVAGALLALLAAAACPGPNAAGTCQSADDCREHEVCVDGLCRRVCNANADCTAHERCLNGVCVPDTGGDAAAPDSAQRDRVVLDRAALDRDLAERSLADASPPDAVLSDSPAPDAAVIDSGSADVPVPDAAAADAAWPDTAVADGGGRPEASVTDGGGQIDGGVAADGGVIVDSFPDPWWNAGFTRRLRLRFHNAASAEALTDFAVMVVLSPECFDYAVAQPGGEDLAFVSAEGELLSHEVELWNAGGRSVIWVRVPQIPAYSDDGYIFLYYGSNGGPTSLGNVWTSHYELVLLMSPTGGGSEIADSSSHQRSLTRDGNRDPEATGALGYTLPMPGTLHQIEVPDLDGTGFPQQQGTLTMVLRPEDWTAGNEDVLDSRRAGESNLVVQTGDSRIRVQAYRDDSSTSSLVTYRGAGESYEIFTVVWTPREPGNSFLRYHSLRAYQQITALDLAWVPRDQRFILSPGNFVGFIDDVRLQNVARSRDWVEAQLSTMHDIFVLYELAPVLTAPEVASDPDAWARVPEVLYEFDEMAGSAVYDVAPSSTPLDLHIADIDAVTWLPGALRLDRATVIESSAPAAGLVDDCQAAGELSVEVWLQPDHALLKGPARIVSLSLDTTGGDFVLGQDLAGSQSDRPRYIMRLRTDDTDATGRMNLGGTAMAVETPDLPAFAPRPARTQVVFTYDGTSICPYVDGQLSPAGCALWTGSFAPWEDFYLRLGNEWSDQKLRYARPWLGTLYRVAIYCQALTGAEVLQNYQVGSGG